MLAVEGAGSDPAPAASAKGKRPSAGDANPEDAGAVADAEARARSAWKLGLLVFCVLGAAYLGAYELLTASAKRERASLLQVHGPAIESFPDPGPPPPTEDSKALRDYRPAHERFVDRSRYETLGSRVQAMFLGLMGAFGLQTALTAFLAIKSWRRARPAPARAKARTSRA